MALKMSFKQQRKQTKMHSEAMAGKNSFDKFHKQTSYPFAVLPVCMQIFLILILQLSFSNFWGFYVPLYCFEI